MSLWIPMLFNRKTFLKSFASRGGVLLKKRRELEILDMLTISATYLELEQSKSLKGWQLSSYSYSGCRLRLAPEKKNVSESLCLPIPILRSQPPFTRRIRSNWNLEGIVFEVWRKGEHWGLKQANFLYFCVQWKLSQADHYWAKTIGCFILVSA